jgi:aspartyl/asparaginyl-tRNA synthetase
MIKLLKITLLISLGGIFLLILLMNALKLELVQISSLNDSQLNKNVKISGQIMTIKTFEESNFQIIDIGDKTGIIQGILDKPINLSKNQTVVIEGTLQKYKKQLQIQVDKINSI